MTEAAPAALPANLRGALWMIASGCLFSLQGVVVKWLGARLDPFEMQFFRCVFSLAAVLPFALWPALRAGNFAGLRTRRFATHLGRAAIGYGGMTCGFYALTHLSLAEATALGFTRPLFLLVLAVWALGETVGRRRTAATLVGFLGVLLIVRPGAETFNPVSLIGLLGALFIADVAILVKKLSATESPTTIMFYFSVMSTLVSLPAALLFWITPTIGELALLAFVAFAVTGGQWLSIRAYAIAEASAMAPFDAVRLLFAVAYGWIFFAEWPTAWTFLGAGVLVLATIYIAHREYVLGKRRGPAAG